MEYLRKAHHPPLGPIHRYLASASDKLFLELKTHTPKPPLRERVRRDWIYDETWASMDTRVTARQEGDQRTVRKLS